MKTRESHAPENQTERGEIHAIPADLYAALEQRSQRMFKPKSTVLFRRGEKAFGAFLILKGRINLDFGVDVPFTHGYGPGSLIGLPATLKGHPYGMTATVTENSELGFLPPETLELLLNTQPIWAEDLRAISRREVSD